MRHPRSSSGRAWALCLRCSGPALEFAGENWSFKGWATKLGTCWKCTLLSALCFAASAAALLAAIQWSYTPSVIGALTVTTALLLGLTAAHIIMFITRSAVSNAYSGQGTPLADKPRRTCCGQTAVYSRTSARPMVAELSTKMLIFRSHQSPGDIVMLTAAVRDVQLRYPGRFVIDVRTPCPHLWENNPHLTPLDETDPAVEIIDCHYPLIHRSNQEPYHFIEGYLDFLNRKLGLHARTSAFKGDIHISALEKSWFSQVEEITGRPTNFWIVAAGGKRDFTIKWWDNDRYQQVVDHFHGRILFAQVGENGHHHPPLHGVIDLRGKTDLRQLVRLVYHSQGVLCPVTLLMHLAAAVEVKERPPQNRPCVVVAGGREPPHWETYPHHQFLHTVGALACCDSGGCWKSRTLPLGDGDEKDRPENLCVDVVDHLPRCMDMITVEEVIGALNCIFRAGQSNI